MWRLYMIVPFLVGLPVANAQDTLLTRYIEQGLKNNQGLRQQNFILQRHIYALKEARAYFLPEVNFNSTYLDSRGGRKISIPIGDLLNPVYTSLNHLTSSSAFPQVENVNQTFNPSNYYDAKFRTSLPIYQAEIRYNRRIQAEQLHFQQSAIDVYRRELVKDIKLAFYAVMQARESIQILENAVVLARENLRYNQVLVSNDKAIRTVVSRSENELIGLEAKVEEARYQAINAAAYLNFLLNNPLDTPVETEVSDQQIPDAVPVAVFKREEVNKLESLAKINKLSEQLAKSAALPRLATFLDLGSQGNFSNFNQDTRYFLFGVTLDWRIFAGYRAKYKAKQAGLDGQAIGEQTDQVEQQLKLQEETAKNLLLAAIRTYQAAQSQTTLSAQYYQDQQKLYREGQRLYLELLDAQNQLISDQMQQSISYLNVKTRTAELERAQASYTFLN